MFLFKSSVRQNSFDYRLADMWHAINQFFKNISHQYFSVCFGVPPKDHFYLLVEFFGLLNLNDPTITELGYNQDSAVAKS